MKKLKLRLVTELGRNRTYTSSVCSTGLKQGQKTYQELKDTDSRLVQLKEHWNQSLGACKDHGQVSDYFLQY